MDCLLGCVVDIDILVTDLIYQLIDLSIDLITHSITSHASNPCRISTSEKDWQKQAALNTTSQGNNQNGAYYNTT